MSIAGHLASALGHRDEGPNIALAEEIAEHEDGGAVAELVGIAHQGTRATQADAIKVLYEIGGRRPDTISGHQRALLALTASGNNRMVWGALIALKHIAVADCETIWPHLEEILAAADRSSVIAKNQAIEIMAALLPTDHCAAVVPKLWQCQRQTPQNQLPLYAELVHPALPEAYHGALRDLLAARLEENWTARKRQRLEKLVGKLGG